MSAVPCAQDFDFGSASEANGTGANSLQARLEQTQAQLEQKEKALSFFQAMDGLGT
jgi:hypothetical protein